jgi:hypothetical protein
MCVNWEYKRTSLIARNRGTKGKFPRKHGDTDHLILRKPNFYTLDVVPSEANCYWDRGVLDRRWRVGIAACPPPKKFCVSKASEEHFPCFLRRMLINVMNFLHLKIQDFTNSFYNFLQLHPPVLK